MAYETISNGLTLIIPQKGQKTWTDTFKSSFAVPISSHDHTGGGKGTVLGANSIANSSIIEQKLADGAVSSPKLLGGAPQDLFCTSTTYTGWPNNTGTFLTNSCGGKVTRSGHFCHVSLTWNFSIIGNIEILKLEGLPQSLNLGREQEVPARIAGLSSLLRSVSVYIPGGEDFGFVWALNQTAEAYRPFPIGSNINTALNFIYLAA